MFKILNPKFYILIIIIIAVFLRLYNITQLPPGLYPDEAMNGNNALEALSTRDFSAESGPASGWKVFYPENNGREGLFINIQAVFLKFLLPLTGGNPEPWMLRLPSAIFGILTVLGVYFLTKELFNIRTFNVLNIDVNVRTSDVQTLKISHGEKIALLSLFFLAVSFWHINFSRIGFRAIMAPFFLVWGVYFLLKSLNLMSGTSDVQDVDVSFGGNNRTSDVQKFNWKSTIIGGIFYGLGFYSYIAYRATPILILIILFLYWFKIPRGASINGSADFLITRKKILLVASGYILMAMLIAAPLGIYFLENPQDFFGRTTQVSVFSSSAPLKDLGMNILKIAGMFNFVGDWNWRHNIAGRPLLVWPVGIIFLIGIFIAIKNIIQNSKFRIQNLILFSWLIVAALPVVISNEGMPHALRAIIMIPPIFILAGAGGAWLIEKIKSQISNFKNKDKKLKIFYFLLATFCFLLLFEAYNTYFILWGENPNVQGAFATDYAQIGKELRDLPKELPKYVIVEANGVDVRGIPMPAQTVMFLTDTFAPKKQKEKNLYYVLPKDINKIPQNAYTIILK